MSFTIPDSIHTSLKDIFGFDEFLEGQEEVISRIVDQRRSCLAVFPTGRGKSLCYQLSSLHLEGLTLVISPLVALMKDQVDFLNTRSIPAARLDSSLSAEEFKAIQYDLKAGRLKLLYVAPERFSNERFLASLKQLPISMMVIDEAHCISEWGHNFRPDYLKLVQITKDLGIALTLALTATATPTVAEDICRAFNVRKEDYIHTGFYRPNLALNFSPSDDPMSILLARLAKRPRASTIVYVTLQAGAEKVAEKLCDQGYEAKAYHAGMENEDRHAVQEWFMNSDQGIVVATIAFGMGIDKADIRYIYHYNIAKSLENYAQEIGRAGRDGLPATCETLGSEDDLIALENFIYGDTPDPVAIDMLIRHLLNEEDRFDVSTYSLSQEYDMRPLVVNTLLTYLELEKVIESTGPFFTQYKFIPNRSSAEILGQFDEQRAVFLRTMFSCAQKAQKWFTLNIEEAVAKCNSTRERVVTALNYLEEHGELTLKVSGSRRGYRIRNRLERDQVDELIGRLQERFANREKNDLKRLQQVTELVNHDGCRTRFLLSYFGEELGKDCGHCCFCLNENEQGALIPKERSTKISQDERAAINELIAEELPALASTRQQARFLAGIRSPKAGRAKLYKRKTFGLLSHIPFADIMNFVKTI